MPFFSFFKCKVSIGTQGRVQLNEFEQRLTAGTFTSSTSDEYKKWKGDVEAWIIATCGVGSKQFAQFQTITTWYQTHETSKPGSVSNAYDRMLTMGYDKATMQNMEELAWDKLVESIGIQKEIDADQKRADEAFADTQQKHAAAFRAEVKHAFTEWAA